MILKISILTATFNRANLLKNLYESIKNAKTNLKIEWLIMDDGSTDNTEKIIEECSKEKKFDVKYFRQKNQGKMVAINKLVKKATGDYLVECDSDDYFTNEAFSIIE